MKENVVRDKSFDFSLLLIKSLKYNKRNYLHRSLIDQVLRSGTSIGANIEEALGAQSRKDFISKMSIAYKECRETIYWLRLIRTSGLDLMEYPSILLTRSIEIIKILTQIINTAKSNLR